MRESTLAALPETKKLPQREFVQFVQGSRMKGSLPGWIQAGAVVTTGSQALMDRACCCLGRITGALSHFQDPLMLNVACLRQDLNWFVWQPLSRNQPTNFQKHLNKLPDLADNFQFEALYLLVKPKFFVASGSIYWWLAGKHRKIDVPAAQRLFDDTGGRSFPISH